MVKIPILIVFIRFILEKNHVALRYSKTPTGKKRYKYLEGDEEEGKKEKKKPGKKKKG